MIFWSAPPAQVGPVALPAGKRQLAGHTGQLVAWATVEPMPDAGRTWLALSAVSADTGLIPALLEPVPPIPEDPEPYFGFYWPVDVALLDQVSAESLLAWGWAAHCANHSTDGP